MRRILACVVLAGLISASWACTSSTSSNSSEPPVLTVGGSPTELPPAEGTEASGSPSTSSGEIGSTRDNPVPVGSKGTVGDWAIEIVGLTEDADDAIHQANQFNDKPKSGNQYVMVTVRATFAGSGNSDPSFDLGFSAIPDSGNSASAIFAVLPKDLTSAGTIPNGASAVGNVAFEVEVGEASSVVLYVVDSLSFEGNGLFFALH
jgi:hypothetical protein